MFSNSGDQFYILPSSWFLTFSLLKYQPTPLCLLWETCVVHIYNGHHQKFFSEELNSIFLLNTICSPGFIDLVLWSFRVNDLDLDLFWERSPYMIFDLWSWDQNKWSSNSLERISSADFSFSSRCTFCVVSESVLISRPCRVWISGEDSCSSLTVCPVFALFDEEGKAEAVELVLGGGGGGAALPPDDGYGILHHFPSNLSIWITLKWKFCGVGLPLAAQVQ